MTLKYTFRTIRGSSLFDAVYLDKFFTRKELLIYRARFETTRQPFFLSVGAITNIHDVVY